MTLPGGWHKRLTDLFGKRVFFDEPLAGWTYFQVGGPADALIVPVSGEMLAVLRRQIDEALCEIPFLVIGLGSNLIVRDGGVRGIVVVVKEVFNRINFSQDQDDFLVEIGAGVSVREMTEFCQDRGLTGFEFATGIPGSIGGAVCMNAGTREGEIKDRLVSVRLMDNEGRTQIVPREELNFSYRRMELAEGWLIAAATLRLQAGDPEKIRAKSDEIMAWRDEKQPGDQPCAGSIFKNPGEVPAARLIHQAGLKGYRIGGAIVSEKHTNFIVNDQNATAADILALIEHIQKTVREKTGILLEPEVKIIGEDLA